MVSTPLYLRCHIFCQVETPAIANAGRRLEVGSDFSYAATSIDPQANAMAGRLFSHSFGSESGQLLYFSAPTAQITITLKRTYRINNIRVYPVRPVTKREPGERLPLHPSTFKVHVAVLAGVTIIVIQITAGSIQ